MQNDVLLPSTITEQYEQLLLPPTHQRGEQLGALALLRTFFSATTAAWQEGILPVMADVRAHQVDSSERKHGNDFFTAADTASEEIIVKQLQNAYGTEAFRIFGEEKNAYTGNQDAAVTIRIDPIDGTENFKFGKPTWGIMAGAYEGRGENEKQLISVVYYPELYNQFLFTLGDAKAYVYDRRSAVTTTFDTIESQDELSNMLTAVRKHSDRTQRGPIDDVISALEKAGARICYSSSLDAKEALETRGKRASIMDGDYSQVDFIQYAVLQRLGYRVFDWLGIERNIDDPSLDNQKLMIVPPGHAGEQILQIITSIAA
jgi:fructose-1,6-bisphosphatase/inositol monophosphatase family enzyme